MVFAQRVQMNFIAACWVVFNPTAFCVLKFFRNVYTFFTKPLYRIKSIIFAAKTKKAVMSKKTFYDFTAISLQGKEIAMVAFKGKVVLVVNTASKCGLTPQYEGLENLYQTYSDKGLVILGFPCNQFARQEPDTKTMESCLLNYGVSFQMFRRVEVNGDKAHPLYKYLKNELRGFPGNSIKWNFCKFLIDRNGKPVKRFSPLVKPEKMKNDIEILL
jgi:glutathione peroxidase